RPDGPALPEAPAVAADEGWSSGPGHRPCGGAPCAVLARSRWRRARPPATAGEKHDGRTPAPRTWEQPRRPLRVGRLAELDLVHPAGSMFGLSGGYSHAFASREGHEAGWAVSRPSGPTVRQSTSSSIPTATN